MVVAVACQCSDLPSHSHAYAPLLIDGVMRMIEDSYDVIIWVDWKAIARAEIIEGLCDGDARLYCYSTSD